MVRTENKEGRKEGDRGNGMSPTPETGEPDMVRYKVVETTVVTDESLEAILNEWVGAGWQYDDVRFVVGEASKRPSMAFVFFTRRE
jgi:hypothetical protein